MRFGTSYSAAPVLSVFFFYNRGFNKKNPLNPVLLQSDLSGYCKVRRSTQSFSMVLNTEHFKNYNYHPPIVINVLKTDKVYKIL